MADYTGISDDSVVSNLPEELWNCTLFGPNYTAANGYPFEPARFRDYWTLGSSVASPTGRISTPTSPALIVYRTKRFFRFPHFHARFRIDNSLNQNGWLLAVGLLNGQPIGGAAAHFQYKFDGTLADQLYVVGGEWPNYPGINVTSWARPSTFNTADHDYVVVACENLIEFWVDNLLACLMVPGFLADQTFNGPPYGILSYRGPVMANWQGQVEFDNSFSAPTTSLLFAPYNCRIAEGEKIRSRAYPMYDQGTNNVWNSKALGASSTATSQAFPVIGYATRRLSVYLTGASGTVTIAIQLMTSDAAWRTAASVAGANGLNNFDLSPYGGILGRAQVSTGAASSVTISRAEASLG